MREQLFRRIHQLTAMITGAALLRLYQGPWNFTIPKSSLSYYYISQARQEANNKNTAEAISLY